MKIGFYTVITDAYDKLGTVPKPYRIEDWCEFYFITDEKEPDVPLGWDFVCVPRESNESGFMYNRRLKFSFPEFMQVDYSVYIDGSISIGSNLEKIVDFIISANYPIISLPALPERNSLKEEANHIVSLKKSRGGESEFLSSFAHYADDKLFLSENGIILRSHSLQHRRLLSEFGNEVLMVLTRFNVRDQLVTPIVFKKLNLICTPFPFGVRTPTNLFTLHLHIQEKKSLTIVQKLKFWIKQHVHY